MSEEKEYHLGFFHKYLTVWVALCILIGIGLGATFPAAAQLLNSLQVAQANIPVAIFLFVENLICFGGVYLLLYTLRGNVYRSYVWR